MRSVVSFLAEQKFKFDVGQSVAQLVQIILLVLAASDKISSLVHLPAKLLIAIIVPLYLLFIWLAGHIMVKSKFFERYLHEHNKNNEMLKNICNKNT